MSSRPTPVRHLLVTNDFPPKVGGIQSYLWELWRRLDPSSFTVLTTPYRGAAAFDAQQPFLVVRSRQPVLLPNPVLARQIDALADEVGAEVIVLDPAVPLGAIGRFLQHPYGVVVHGAEVTVPGRLPASAQVLGSVLRGARFVVAAGGYPLAEAERCAGRPLVSVVVPPGVDAARVRPALDAADKRSGRMRLGLPADGPLVTSASRLVPRKGMDVLIDAGVILRRRWPDLTVAISGAGRDRQRLDRRIAGSGAPVRMLGRLSDDDLTTLYAVGDVFAMLCRTRWAGLEQEGFGIVFVEAAAAAVPQVAGASGGAAEAVEHGVTGLIVDDPRDAHAVADAIGSLLADPDRAAAMGEAARARVERELSYDVLADRLASFLAQPHGPPTRQTGQP
jgi:phosphatidyl-myo-inositol dimannoside synthase